MKNAINNIGLDPHFKAVVLDVDGTIVDGNLTFQLMQHLFENRSIDYQHFEIFSALFNRYMKGRISFDDVIRDALLTLYRLPAKQLGEQAAGCFRERVGHRINPRISYFIGQCRKNGHELFLASASPIECVLHLAGKFSINPGNCAASCCVRHAGADAGDNEVHICHGERKFQMVRTMLEKRGMGLDLAYFMTDNLSDLGLLKRCRGGCWAGSPKDYYDHGMDKNGIQLLHDGPTMRLPGTEGCGKAGNPLTAYYEDKRTLLKRSVAFILPEKCTRESLEELAGYTGLSWDLETLQEVFFTPAWKYIRNLDDLRTGLGCCILLEEAGIDPEMHLALIGIGDILEASSNMFLDIREWTNEKNHETWGSSFIDIAITGNVSISLLSMVLNKVICNSHGLDPHIKWRFYESITELIFRSLFGNGLKLFREQQGIMNMEEYRLSASLVNAPRIQIPLDLWEILRNERLTPEEVRFKKGFVFHSALAIQLSRDISAYECGRDGLTAYNGRIFDPVTNFLCLDAVQKLHGTPFSNPHCNSGEAGNIIPLSGSYEYARNEFIKNREEALSYLERMPLKPFYKDLFMHYTNLVTGQ